MAINTSLERVGRVDFFAIMAPGFYIFTTTTIVASGLLEGVDSKSVWHRLINAWHPSTQLWFLGFGVLFFSYLLGNMLRALRVDLADDCTRFLKSKTPWLFGEESEEREGFPYPAILKKVEKEIGPLVLGHSNSVIPEMKPEEKPSQYLSRLHDRFNYWKMVLCHEDGGNAFVFTQELEARVRLFAGMFWAGAVSFAVAVLGGFVVSWNLVGIHLIKPDWWKPMVLLSGLSFVLCSVFTSQLRRVRKHEVRQLFTAYLALLRRGNNQPPANPPANTTSSGSEALPTPPSQLSTIGPQPTVHR